MIVPTSAKVGIARFYYKNPADSKESSGVFAMRSPKLVAFTAAADYSAEYFAEALLVLLRGTANELSSPAG